MADEKKISIPDAPALLPPAEAKKWQAAYAAAFKEAQNDFPEDPIRQRQIALKEANKLMKVPDPTDFKSAMAIPDHLVVSRIHDKKKGTLKLVTAHGKKFAFDAPKAPEASDAGQQSDPLAETAKAAGEYYDKANSASPAKS